MFSPKNFLRVVSVLALCMMFSLFAVAQSTTSGAIVGTATDQTGAVVPGARVEIKNIDTNEVTTATSDEGGRFRAVNLAPGTYDVKVTASGFGDYKTSRLVVEVGRASNVDATMNVTGRGETIEVVDEAPVINTERQDFAQNINQEAIQNLPINGRRWSNYALMTPNANPDGTFGLISFRGISGLLNNTSVDGGDNNNNFYGEERGRTRLSYSTSQDSVREFQVNTSNYSAEYGRSAGGVVNTVTKSGSNSLHGSGYWYFRDNALGATNPSSFLSGQPFKADDRRQQFGATLGGPIVKDRVFFFFNYDQQKRNFPGLAIPFTSTSVTNIGPVGYGQYTVTNPTAAGKAACPASGTLPSSGTGAYSVGEAIFCRFGGNAALGQAAANAGFAFFTNLLGPNPRTGDQLLFFPKVDVRLGGGNLAVSYNWLNWTSPGGIQTQPTNTIARDQFGDDLARTRSLNAIFNRAIGSRSALETRFHWSSENLSGGFQTPIPGQPSVPGVTGSHTPGVSVAAWLNFGTQTYLPRPSNPYERQFQGSGSLSHSAGRHTWKFGGEILHQKEEVQSLFQAYGTFGYTGSHAYADFLADAFNSTATDFTGSGVRRCGAAATPRPCYANLDQSLGTLGYAFDTNDYAFFIQDDIKLYPRLTVNLGLRYERQAFPEPQFPQANVLGTQTKVDSTNNWGPRGGLALDILGNGKLVFRGGTGIYYGRIINSTMAAALTNTGNPTAQPNYRVASTSAVATLYPNILTAATGLTATPNSLFFDAEFRNPKIYQSDAILEYEFMKNTVASVSYINSQGRGLITFLDTNLPAAYAAAQNTFTRPDGSTFTIPSYGTAARPNTAYAQIGKITNTVDSDYNALVFQVTRRMTNNWQLQSSYTWSKATDNGQRSDTFSPSNLNQALDPKLPQQEYGLSNYDVPHKFVFAAIWQPQFFKAEKNAAHYIFDDWSIAPILNFSSGFTYTGTISGNLPTGFCASSHNAGINCANPGTNRDPAVEKNTFRTTPRNIIDLRLSRFFRITEGTKLEFLAEAFNLFNRSNVSGVNSAQYAMGSCTLATATCALTAVSSFGVPSTINGGTNLRERQVQFAVRFQF